MCGEYYNNTEMSHCEHLLMLHILGNQPREAPNQCSKFQLCGIINLLIQQTETTYCGTFCNKHSPNQGVLDLYIKQKALRRK